MTEWVSLGRADTKADGSLWSSRMVTSLLRSASNSEERRKAKNAIIIADYRTLWSRQWRLRCWLNCTKICGVMGRRGRRSLVKTLFIPRTSLGRRVRLSNTSGNPASKCRLRTAARYTLIVGGETLRLRWETKSISVSSVAGRILL